MSTHYDMLYTRYQREVDQEAAREDYIESVVREREDKGRSVVLDILRQHGVESSGQIEEDILRLPEEAQAECGYWLDEYPLEPLEEPGDDESWWNRFEDSCI